MVKNQITKNSVKAAVTGNPFAGGSIPLEQVPEPESLRDYILEEWKEFRKKKYPSAPESLRSTSAKDPGNKSASHQRGSAIDIVTERWEHRRYLIPFGLWLRRRNSAVNVIFYSRKFQPHLHVAVWSAFTGKSDNSLAVNLDASGKYKVWQPSEIAKDSKAIADKLAYVLSTYPETPGEKIDLAAMEKELAVTPDIQADLKRSVGFLELLKKYWWIGGISIVLLIVFIIAKKAKGDTYD